MKNVIVTAQVKRLMDKYPLYSQDGKGDTAKVLFKVFNPYGSGSWYVLEAGEKDENGDRVLFGLVVLNGEVEYGYFMLSDLTKTKVNVFGYDLPLERDIWFKGTVANAKKDAYIAQGGSEV